MLIQDMNDTVTVQWSELNKGFMYCIYRNRLLTEDEIVEQEIQEDDGGLCTGTIGDAIEMAGINIYN